MTFWAVAVFFGVLVIVGIVVWLRRTEHEQPTRPRTPSVGCVQPASLPPGTRRA